MRAPTEACALPVMRVSVLPHSGHLSNLREVVGRAVDRPITLSIQRMLTNIVINDSLCSVFGNPDRATRRREQEMPKKLLVAITAGLGTCLIVAVSVAILPRLVFGALGMEGYPGPAVIVIWLIAIGVGILVGCTVYKLPKQQSPAAQ